MDAWIASPGRDRLPARQSPGMIGSRAAMQMQEANWPLRPVSVQVSSQL